MRKTLEQQLQEFERWAAATLPRKLGRQAAWLAWQETYRQCADALRIVELIEQLRWKGWVVRVFPDEPGLELSGRQVLVEAGPGGGYYGETVLECLELAAGPPTAEAVAGG